MAARTTQPDNVNKGSCGACILDLCIDNIVQCASFLCPKDLASLTVTCKHLRDAVYCDSIWENQCRKRWPSKQLLGTKFQFLGGKKAYEERVKASQKFEFLDPYDLKIDVSGTRVNHLILEDNSLYITQGPSISVYDVESPGSHLCLVGHNAQITCMRLVPSTGILSLRNRDDDIHPVVVTSSMDHTIRLWRKGHGLRTLRGHSGPVATLCNSLLGGQYGKPILASGGMDGTIRLWNLSSGQKRGSSPLVKTFHGHDFAVKLNVAEYGQGGFLL